MTEDEFRERVNSGLLVIIVMLGLILGSVFMIGIRSYEQPVKAAEPQSRVYLPVVQQPCPCTCPSSTTTTTAKSTTTTTTLLALGYLEWFHTNPGYIMIPASGDPQSDQVFQITGNGFGPPMKAYLPMIGRSYYEVTITSRTTGTFTVPYVDQTTTGNRDEMQNIYAMLFDENGRASDIHSIDIVYK